MSDCQETTCGCADLYAYIIAEADGADDASPEHVCPEGMVWGGKSCTAGECSDGYKSDGVECILDDEDFECAEGYHLVTGDCVPCTPPQIGVELQLVPAPYTGAIIVVPAFRLYALYLYDNGQGSLFATGFGTGAPSSKYVHNPVKGHEYCFELQITNSDGCNPYSKRLCSVCANPTPPP